MKVYEFQGFPNPARVRIALAELGMIDDIEFVSINVPEGEHRSDAFKAKNPFSAVPVLELDDGTMISECSAITAYLDMADGKGKLLGSSVKQIGVIQMMQRRAESQLLDAVATYFHHATDGLGPNIETYQNQEWGQHMGQVAVEGLRYFEGVLGDQSFIAGDQFSIADITVIAGLSFADFAQIAIPEECANLIAWRAKTAARPSVANLWK